MSASYARKLGLRVVPEVEVVAHPTCPPRVRRCHAAASRCVAPDTLVLVWERCTERGAEGLCPRATLDRCDTLPWRWL